MWIQIPFSVKLAAALFLDAFSLTGLSHDGRYGLKINQILLFVADTAAKNKRPVPGSSSSKIVLR